MKSRREFLKFLGASAVAGSVGSCAASRQLKRKVTTQDSVVLYQNLKMKILIEEGDQLSKRDHFGSDSDFNHFYPLDSKGATGLLWNNHEHFSSLLLPEALKDREEHCVGGSIVYISREPKSRFYRYHRDSPWNRRIDALTPIPLDSTLKIGGQRKAFGTLANCSGGHTPWGTILTCEENYYLFVGERLPNGTIKSSDHGWERKAYRPPEHYGWVVEVWPKTGKAIKRTALGRFAHEGATVVSLPDGRVVVYMGDDQNDQCIYKFISKRPKSLLEGTLYVANVESGKWISLDWNSSDILKKNFSSPIEALINTRKAAELVGGTPLDRPEDIEIHPKTGDIYISLTNNKPKGRYHGSLLRLRENNGRYDATGFKSSTWLAGGEEMGFSSPDNLLFDRHGNLWMTTDMSFGEHYEDFGNNALFFIPTDGPQAGLVQLVATAPKGAEFTGPCFSPDQKTLFLSVQHPGEGSKTRSDPTSHWPRGGNALPRSAVIMLAGPFLEKA